MEFAKCDRSSSLRSRLPQQRAKKKWSSCGYAMVVALVASLFFIGRSIQRHHRFLEQKQNTFIREYEEVPPAKLADYQPLGDFEYLPPNPHQSTKDPRRQPKSWEIPPPKNVKCPTFCGSDPMEFELFARNSTMGISLEKGRKSKTFFRVNRMDYLPRIRRAVEEIDASGDFDKNSYCKTFDSCSLTRKNRYISRHSEVYLVCNSYKDIHASKILQGAATATLPGYLRDEGDENIMCQMAQFITKLVEEAIFPYIGWNDKKCIVQELFVNQQRRGGMTVLHNHPDDFFGGVFYLDVPKGTKLCFHDSEGTEAKIKWWQHAPELTERLFPGGPPDYPGHVIPRAGDIIFFPVGWAQHWVPELQCSAHEKRTSVVFNMICL